MRIGKKVVGQRAPRKSRLRVGVTLFVRDENQTIWENGIFQNCFFLIQTLQHSPVVEWCCVVASGPGEDNKSLPFLASAGCDVIRLSEAMETLDVVIELSAQLDPAWGRSFVERGGRIVAMRVASDFIIDSERMAFDLSPGLLMSGVPYQEIWTLPAFKKTCATYYEVGCRAPVKVMQHLWSPALLEKAAAASDKQGTLQYMPGRQRWRAAVLEPNICSVKTCHVPLLICENAYRTRPQIFETVRIFNTNSLRENDVFVKFARSLDLIQNGVASFEGRFPIIEVLGPYVDVIVSHHWENAQNYLYYEALYLGYPLIHNSTMIDDCGYRYADFDPQDGGRALVQAYLEHDRNLASYLADSRRLLAKLNPVSDANVRLYGEAIAGLFDAERFGTSSSAPHRTLEPVV